MAGSQCMEPFRVLEHTADIGFEARGATRGEVFANAARALQDLLVDLAAIEPREEMTLRVEGEDAPALLVNWLSHILYLIDAEGRVFRISTCAALTTARSKPWREASPSTAPGIPSSFK